MALTKVLVTVKTYPLLSTKYIETVCTAGFKEDGSWIRIFPVPFRMLNIYERFSKWQWIEVDLERNPSHDERPESHHITSIDSLKILGSVDRHQGKADWDVRRMWMEKGKSIYTNMSELIRLAKNNTVSLAVLKPSDILDFVIEPKEDTSTDKRKTIEEKLQAEISQLNVFDEQTWKENFRLAEQIPFKFSYKFKTDDGKIRKLMIEDWEIMMLYRNCLDRCGGDISIACRQVKEKYLDMAQKDLHLFLGTVFRNQRKNTPNPYVIIGVVPLPMKDKSQLSFDF